MNRLIDRLAIGGISCHDPGEEWSVVCACKSPCYTAACQQLHKAQQLPASHRDYLAIEQDHRLILNMIDPPLPLFRVEQFERFLEWMTREWKSGRSILIHCSDGGSRSASLALVFMSKVLGILPDDSFDAAWDAFEAITHYEPSAGIEAWLRDNWTSVKASRIGYIEGAAIAEEDPDSGGIDWDAMDEETAGELAKTWPAFWFSGFARIVGKNNLLTAENDCIEPNVAQQRAFDAYQWCVMNGQPIRLVLGPKPRQSGISTCACAICVVHSMNYRVGGMVIGDTAKRTSLLWEMFRGMIRTNRRKSAWCVSHDPEKDSNSDVAKFRYSDGKDLREFQWSHDTAGDNFAGSSGTRHIVWFSEPGLYSKSGAVTDSKVISNASNSVPPGPNTLIILESVAGGAAGHFHDTVKGAVTLEQRKQGIMGNGFIKVFCAWWEVPEYSIARDSHNGDLFRQDLNEREQRGVALYKWTAEQIAWRRWKLDELHGDTVRFDSEFPDCEEVAFQTSGSPRFDESGVSRIEEQAETLHDVSQTGYLEERDGNVIFMPDPKGWLWLREKPQYRARYLTFGDYMTGAQSEGSIERDEHAVGVWKAACVGDNAEQQGEKLVAAITHPIGVRWEEHVIAQRTWLLSRFFGNCIIVMEVNEALGVLSKLEDVGANLWKRMKKDRLVPGQTLQTAGWKTTSATKDLIVSKMAEFIYEQRGEIAFKPLAHQLRVFVTNPNGSCSALHGEHDDWVMGAGIGLACITVATEYKEPRKVIPFANLNPVPGGGSGRSKGSAALG